MSERVYSSEPSEVGVTPYRTGFPAFRQLSWGAVLAGTFGAIAIQLLLTLLGLAIGMLAFNPADVGDTGAGGIAVGAVIWGLLSMIIALFCGGWIAGWAVGPGRQCNGAIHGFLAWCLLTVFSFLAIGTATGALFGGAAALAGEAIQTGARQVENPAALIESAREATDDISEEDLERQARDVGQDVSTAGAATFFWAFLTLLFGAIAATWAGQKGAASAARKTGRVAEDPAARI